MSYSLEERTVSSAFGYEKQLWGLQVGCKLRSILLPRVLSVGSEYRIEGVIFSLVILPPQGYSRFSASPDNPGTLRAIWPCIDLTFFLVCKLTSAKAGMISSFSHASAPMQVIAWPHQQFFSSSGMSWIISTRGRSAGRGLRPRLIRA